MITSSFMYWITRLDEVCCVVGILSVIAIVGTIAIAFPLASEYFSWKDCNRKYRDDINDTAIPSIRRVFLWFAISSIVLMMASIFIPTTKEAAAIIVVPKIANSESVAEVSTAVKDAAIKWLKETAADVEKHGIE